MIAGGDIKIVQTAQETYCGDVVEPGPRENCERLVADKFKEVCSKENAEVKTSCETDLDEIFSSQYQHCKETYEKSSGDETDRLEKIASCFHNNVQGKAKGEESKAFNTSQFKQQKLNDHINIIRRIYSPKPSNQSGNISFKDTQKKLCASGVGSERKNCAEKIREKYDEVHPSHLEKDIYLREFIDVLGAVHKYFSGKTKKTREAVKAFAAELASTEPTTKFDIGDVKQLTLPEYMGIFKRRFPTTK